MKRMAMKRNQISQVLPFAYLLYYIFFILGDKEAKRIYHPG